MINLTNSTLSGNSAGRNGGGISVENTTNLLNVTITNNSASNAGGGVRVQSGLFNVKNTIVAGNPTGGNCSNALFSQGYNLEDTNTCSFNQTGDQVNASPLLGPLQDNGGLTHTHALLTGSDAIDGGTNTGAPATDQRGVARPIDGDGDSTATVDVGAFEASPSPAVPGAIWRQSGQNIPLYSGWDGSSFTGTQSSQVVGEWRIIQGAEAPTRDEAIVLGVDAASGNVTGEMWDGSSWAALPINPLGNMSQTFWWGFDVAYEPVSGDAVVVSTDGGNLRFWVWNGSTWTGPTNLTLPVGGTPRHLQLAAHPYQDELVLIVSNSNSQDYAFVWDGASWGNSIVLDNGGGGDRTDINVAYEQQSGTAMVVFGKGTDDVYYRRWTGAGWSSESMLSGIGFDYARWLTVGADPSSNSIALGVNTNDSDVWLAVWDGSAWIDQTTVTTGSTGVTEPAVAVAFEGLSGRALATYGEPTNTPRYRTWTSGSGWSAEASTPGIGAQPNSQMLYPEPGADGIMLAVNDDSNDIHYLYWNGSAWGPDNELETNSGDDKNQPFLFLWEGVAGSPPGCTDADSDGLCDLEEDANTDLDNNPATNPGPDTDGDTTPNYLDADDDGDGTPTASEGADPNADGDPRDARDADRDGEPDYLDAPTSAADGTVATEQKISDTQGGLTATLTTNDHFGRSVASIGDVDGDGIADLAVGAPFDDDGGSDRGAVYVLFLNANGTVKSEQKISDTAGGLATPLANLDEFGMGVAGIGDLDG
ncbi:MAG: FG-GAP repeat protein, partial [Acidimicrobiia bacterium]|nr:FG-GAP repeat protein [Acidimicrobiia bacterium]